MAPVLNFEEATAHPVNLARRRFTTVGDVPQATPAPRFSRSVPGDPTIPSAPGEEGRTILADLGYTGAQIAEFSESGALKSPAASD